MIYRKCHPLWDASFRERFYNRWGRECAAIRGEFDAKSLCT
ncbi:MAG TPA: hypothetical protein VGH75_09485 [Steroidobacteraceae bacterium]